MKENEKLLDPAVHAKIYIGEVYVQLMWMADKGNAAFKRSSCVTNLHALVKLEKCLRFINDRFINCAIIVLVWFKSIEKK